MHFRFIFAFMERLKHILIILFALSATSLSAREVINFNKDWKFCLNLETDSNPADIQFDDSGWRTLDVPHDWAIEGDFDEHNPSGTGGGALPGGIGWYRKNFKVSKKDQGKIISIEFDGVYMNSTVWLNGHKLGSRPYGYSSFEYDMTPFINRGGENLLVVKVDNSDQPNSRWYSGCGIYRHVWMTTTSRTHVAHWGSYVTATVSKNNRKATFDVEVTLENATKATQVTNTLVDRQGREVGRAKGTVAGESVYRSRIAVSNPRLWTLDNPYIYKVRTEVRIGNEIVDVYETNT